MTEYRDCGCTGLHHDHPITTIERDGFVYRMCSSCGKHFQTTKKSADTCYDCCLSSITDGTPPEEGDFNTAAIQSGKLSEKERKWLQEDWASIEEGRSIREPIGNDLDQDYIDPAWCGTCNKDTAFCDCICHKCYNPIDECTCDEEGP